MKAQFLKNLNHELGALTKAERDRYVNEYEEIISDKVENGMTEEEAVSSLGEVKHIANDILRSYAEQSVKEDSSRKNHFNRLYAIFDAMVLIISFLLAYSYLVSFRNEHLLVLPYTSYISALVYIMPIYLFIYYLFKVYTIECTRKKSSEVINIFLANIVGFFVLIFILYLFKQMHFPRILVFTFTCINTLFEIIARLFIYKNIL